MNEDAELLRRFAQSGDEDAFSELVGRHLDFVYGVALRRVGDDAHLADDVCQDVFCALARKAAKLAGEPVLKAWLHTAAQFSAAKAVRSAVRRRAREQEAHSMRELNEAKPENWEAARPVIDAAIAELGDKDRSAVLLRFFEERSFGEIGQRLGLSEDGARMRLDRALDKLSGILSRRGVKSTGSALAICLAQQTSVAAPASLAPSVMVAAKAAVANGATLAGLWHSMTIAQTKMAVAGAVGLALAATITIQHRANAQLAMRLDDLDAQSHRAGALRIENETLKRRLQEAQTAREEQSEVETLRAANASRAPSSATRSSSTPTVAAGLVPMDQLQNRGNATPSAAFETLYWAKAHHDYAVVESLLATMPQHRADADAAFAQLPAAVRAKHPEATTSEQYFAREWVANSGNELGIQVDAQMAIDDDRIYLSGHRQLEKNVSNFDIVLRRTDQGWKWFPDENNPAAALKLSDKTSAVGRAVR